MVKLRKVKHATGDDDVVCIHDYNLDYKTNEIYLMGEEKFNDNETGAQEPGVEYIMANRFIKNLNMLTRRSKDNVLVHMKTNGGDWMEGMAIYDAIKLCPNYVTILNYTHARSMSSLIFLAADERVMMPHSTYMFHEGTIVYDGTSKQGRTEGKEDEKNKKIMINIYVNHLKNSPKGSLRTQSKKEIKQWLIDQMNEKEEVYINAKKAVKLGFADRIYNGRLNNIVSLPEEE